jgi:hypothetical protein
MYFIYINILIYDNNNNNNNKVFRDAHSRMPKHVFTYTLEQEFSFYQLLHTSIINHLVIDSVLK